MRHFQNLQIGNDLAIFLAQGVRNPQPFCRVCKVYYASRRPFSSSPRNHQSHLPLSERIRRRIWGTDQPPGRIDPYDPNSPMREPQPREVERKPSRPAESEVGPAEEEYDLEDEDGILDEQQPFEFAPVMGDALEDKRYKPASTWDDLPRVGGKVWRKANIPPPAPFKGYIEKPKGLTEGEIAAALHRALVEVFTLCSEGRSPLDASKPGKHNTPYWTAQVHLNASRDGQSAELVFPQNEVKELVLKSLPTPFVVEEDLETRENVQEILSSEGESSQVSTELTADAQGPGAVEQQQASLAPKKLKEPPQPRDLPLHNIPGWKAIPLVDPDIKFAVVKRYTQLTGTCIPDPIIGQSQNAGALFSKLIVKPKPKKLAEVLQHDQRLNELSNVRLLARKVTRIDNDESLGRWKVIKQSLLEKGLPLTYKSARRPWNRKKMNASV